MSSKKFKIIACSLLLLASTFTNHAVSQAPSLIDLDSEQGIQRLADSQSKQAFIPMIRYFVTQKTQTYCAIASAVIALNTLEIPSPISPLFYPHNKFTQDNLFTKKVLAITNPALVMQQGLTLDELSKILNTFPVNVTQHYADELSLKELRPLLKNKLKQKNQVIIVNYERKTIGQKAGGHISPLAAYHEKSDSVLIMDVSRYKHPPVWVSLPTLHAAMKTRDNISKKSRGLLILWKN